MRTYEELMERMFELIQEYEQLESNFKKTKDPERRTTKYLEGKVTKTNQIWADYQKLYNEARPQIKANDEIINISKQMEIRWTNFLKELDREKNLAKLRETSVEGAVGGSKQPEMTSTTSDVEAFIETMHRHMVQNQKTTTNNPGSEGTANEDNQQPNQGSNDTTHDSELEEAIAIQKSAFELWNHELKRLARKVLTESNPDELKREQEFIGEIARSAYDNHNNLVRVQPQRLHPYFVSKTYENKLREHQQLMEQISFARQTLKRQPIPLPALKLKQFDGNCLNWISFKELFSEVIDRNPNLSAVEKLEYLKSHLIGEPLNVIKHLSLTDTNYQKAWELLRNRYQNERRIIYSYLNQIFDVKEGRTKMTAKGLADTYREIRQALVDLNVSSADTILTYMVESMMDRETRIHYEQKLGNPNALPKAEDLIEFLQLRDQAMEVNSQTTQKEEVHGQKHKEKRNTNIVKVSKCALCSQDHMIFMCPKFLSVSEDKRRSIVKSRNLCFNCLRGNHPVTECKSKQGCKTCGRRHNTLIHTQQKTTQANFASQQELVTVLATAIIKIKANNGEFVPVRALIDMGSQASFITEHCAQQLQLPRRKTAVQITGMGQQNAGPCTTIIKTQLVPTFKSEFRLKLNMFVMKKLTGVIPSTKLVVPSHQFKDIILADPQFDIPAPIDILLGADVYSQIIKPKMIQGIPHAQDTEFGWILFGSAPPEAQSNQTKVFISTVDLNNQLKKFWEIETIPEQQHLSKDDQECEEIYKASVIRTSTGRYIVKIPFKTDELQNLGESRRSAIARLLGMERTFERHPTLKIQYIDFMKEYVALGHMSKVPKNTIKYYLPHHAVVRPEAITTKLRVVFDGSAQTSSGVCINDTMHIGPKLQRDIIRVLLQWRKERIAVISDIEKMYRQILVAPEDRVYQGILWREHPNQPISEYVLNTVTYGTSAAPYLAIRTLHQLADDTLDKNLSKLIKENFYVDDFMASFPTVETAQKAIEDIQKTLQSAGMTLKKFASNSLLALHNIDKDSIHATVKEIHQGEDRDIKTLGMHWYPIEDTFGYKIQLKTHKQKTMRTLVSDVASLYDPLGLIAPVVVVAKLLIQEGWKQKLKWDQKLPSNIVQRWDNYREDLKHLEQFRIKRWGLSSPEHQKQIHGFCDASEKAYAAVIYLRTKTAHGAPTVTLLAAKTKVAPIQTKMTLAKLELESASLLVDLFNIVRESMDIDDSTTCFAWSDSEITLAWIAKEASNWKTFVANRVSKIRKASYLNWRHISGKENPADLGSRGINASQLASSTFWKHGPMWLQEYEQNWPINKQQQTEEEANITVAVAEIQPFEIIRTCNSYIKMIRVIAYCRRIKTRAKGELSADEITSAEICLLKIVQKETFPKAIQQLKEGRPVTENKLRTLSPFLGPAGLMRVGGRLQKSMLTYNQKHQIILHASHPISKKICRYYHEKHAHCGADLLISIIKQRFHIIRAKVIINSIIFNCVKCKRHKAKTEEQFMCELPTHRVTPTIRPFVNTGLDYFGPLTIRMSPGRGAKTVKAYGCLLVCMATKAIHLEVVIGMDAQGLLRALKRFTARRGLAKNLYSDNGTNMVKSNRMMQDDYEQALFEAAEEIAPLLANDGTKWHFNSPASPHKGGVWEIQVKSTKNLLKKLVGNNVLTYEEMATYFCEVEAILNSRPICSVNKGPDSIILSPAKFLIGDDLTCIPEHQQHEAKLNIYNRYLLISQLKQQFWKQWSNEYLFTLQKRYKWNNPIEDMKTDQIVLIKDENLPPLKWMMGRIMETYLSSDGRVRTVKIKTETGSLIRPIHKLVKLPTHKEEPEKQPESPENKNPKQNRRPKRKHQQSSFEARRSSRLNKPTLNVFLVALLCSMFIPYTSAASWIISLQLNLSSFSHEITHVYNQIAMANSICQLHWNQRHKARCSKLINTYEETLISVSEWVVGLGSEQSIQPCTDQCTIIDITHEFARLSNISTFPVGQNHQELARITTQDDHSTILDYIHLALNTLTIWQTNIISTIMFAQLGHIHQLAFSAQHHRSVVVRIQAALNNSYIREMTQVEVHYTSEIIQILVYHQLDKSNMWLMILIIITVIIINAIIISGFYFIRKKRNIHQMNGPPSIIINNTNTSTE